MRMQAAILFAFAFQGQAIAAESLSLDQARLLEGSKWAVDQDSPEYGLGDSGKYTCSDPLTIIVSDSRDHMTLKFGDSGPTWDAEIVEILDNEGSSLKFLIQYENEKRLGPDDKPFQWVFNLADKDKFFWQLKFQSKDAHLGYTHMRVRCKYEMG